MQNWARKSVQESNLLSPLPLGLLLYVERGHQQWQNSVRERWKVTTVAAIPNDDGLGQGHLMHCLGVPLGVLSALGMEKGAIPSAPLGTVPCHARLEKGPECHAGSCTGAIAQWHNLAGQRLLPGSN